MSAIVINSFLHFYDQNESGKLIDCKRVLETTGDDHDRIKQQFLTAPFFDGKTFWQVERDLLG